MAQFPTTPDPTDQHQEGDVIWIYDGVKWVKQTPIIKTEHISLSDPAHPADVLVTPQAIPDVPADTTTQLDVNRWIANSLTALDDKFEDGDIVAGIHVGENPPTDIVNGTLWFDSSADTLSLFLYYHPDETQPSGVWVPAAPPVSAIEEINGLLQEHEEDIDALEERVLNLNTIGNTPVSPAQDGYIWRDTTLGEERAYIYDGITKEWVSLSPAVTVNDSAPVDPTKGDLWYDNDGNVLYVYHNNNWLPVSLSEEILNRMKDVEEDTQDNTDAIQQLRLEVDELTVSRGKVARYKVDNTIGTPVVRPGELSVNIPFWPNTTLVSFGTEDLDGILTKPIAVGDIIDFIDSATDNLTRYKVTNAASAPTAVNIEYVSGNGDWAREQEKQVYIYPQNESGVSQQYVDDGLALKANKAGDTFTGSVTVSTQGNANNDGVRFYMKDMNGDTNLTLFPTGVVTGKNVIRVNKDAGDCFQVKDSAGSTTKWKVDADGMNTTPKIFLTGGSSSTKDERTIDVKQGIAGHLAYNNKVDLSWGATTVWIGRSVATGDTDDTCTLDLQYNHIVNVGKFRMKNTTKASGSIFSIEGEMQDGTVSDNFFYAYRNAAGTPDAMNYNGKMDNEFNMVNKGYVDNAVSGVDSTTFMPKTGGTFTGAVEFNHSTNAQINFPRTSNNDIQVDGDWYISLQTADGGKVKLSRNLEMTNKEIKGLANPTTGQSAVNRDSLVGAKVVATSNANASSGGFYYNGGRLYYKI